MSKKTHLRSENQGRHIERKKKNRSPGEAGYDDDEKAEH
jgi:hypothetical protein